MLYPDLKDLIALRNQKIKSSLASSQAVKSTAPGGHHSPFRGQGLEFDSVREYVPGDDIRSIDWRVTARTGEPHVKLYREEKERSVLICVDMNAAMRFGTRKTFKSVQAARVAASLGWRSLATHDRVGSLLFGDVPEGMRFFAPDRTRKSLWHTLRMFVEPSSESHFISLDIAVKHLLNFNHSGVLIYIISDFLELSDELERLLNKLNKRCDVVAIAINDAAEKTIPPLEMVCFQGYNSERVIANTDSVEGRRAYREQWDENRQKLSSMLLRQKIPLLAISTEADIPKDLIFGINTLAKRKSS
jgi:uncharacterized protein (DUF58 family)